MNPNADEPPPVQFPHPVNVHSSTFGLFILYILITVLDLFQIIRILCYRCVIQACLGLGGLSNFHCSEIAAG